MKDFSLSDEDKYCLLKVARASIGNVMKAVEMPDYELSSQNLEEKCGAFVTIEIGSRLRGCIGIVESEKPLHLTVEEMAVSSAFRDPRFPPLKSEELDKIVIEISVLSPLENVRGSENIEIGKHGILLKKDYKSGLLLPQVATRYGWDSKEFLKQTCLKAGLSVDAWRDEDCEINVFSAIVFKEGEHGGD
jgi:AmmeMemoRadiSam system protein A